MPTSIGEFWLGQKVSEARGLTELTPAEYLAFANSGWVRAFRDERIFKGPDRAPFQGAFWNLMVGTTGGRIFKLSLQKVTYDPTPRSGELFLRMREYFTHELGPASSHSVSPERHIWDAPEGNVVLEKLDSKEGHAVDIFLTAKLPLPPTTHQGQPEKKTPRVAQTREEQHGWHLLSPPHEGGRVRPDLPLGRWKISLEKFDSLAECQRYRKDYLGALLKALSEKVGKEYADATVKATAEHTECIGANDPRFPK